MRTFRDRRGSLRSVFRDRWGPLHPIFSTDHKVIGLQYALTSLTFLLIGFLLILALRWHLASPTDALPLVGKLLGETRAVEAPRDQLRQPLLAEIAVRRVALEEH